MFSTIGKFNGRSCYRTFQLMRKSSTLKSGMLSLQERGLIENIFPDTRYKEFLGILDKPQSMYCGFDPTADSLHIGNLLTIMTLLHGQKAGHRPIAVIGGATGFIGDPSGKVKDRPAMSAEDVEKNVVGLMENIERIASNFREHVCQGQQALPEFKILNNQDWYKDTDVITFLSTIGRHFRVGEMLTRHSVQSRLQSKEGISCTEFMYQVFQANDWLHLFQNYGCAIQIGGNDQTGNLTSGFDLIHSVTKKFAFGLCVPLVLSPSGQKLGKSTGNSIWLDPQKNSPYELYQYFLNLPDGVMERYLKLFTFLTIQDLSAVMEAQKREPEKRHAQRQLAKEVTLLVHGAEGVSSALKCTEVLFGDAQAALSTLKYGELQQLFQNSPTSEIQFEPKMTVKELSQKLKCFSRDADAERIIKAGGFYINQQRVTEPNLCVSDGNVILPNNVTLLRVGKKTYHFVKWLR